MYGTPKSDVERACQHYGITEAEYMANPQSYPLPPRGTGLNIGGTTIPWGWLVIGIIGLLVLRKK
jgi:hypothetical protein